MSYAPQNPSSCLSEPFAPLTFPNNSINPRATRPLPLLRHTHTNFMYEALDRPKGISDLKRRRSSSAPAAPETDLERIGDKYWNGVGQTIKYEEGEEVIEDLCSGKMILNPKTRRDSEQHEMEGLISGEWSSSWDADYGTPFNHRLKGHLPATSSEYSSIPNTSIHSCPPDNHRPHCLSSSRPREPSPSPDLVTSPSSTQYHKLEGMNGFSIVGVGVGMSNSGIDTEMQRPELGLDRRTSWTNPFLVVASETSGRTGKVRDPCGLGLKLGGIVIDKDESIKPRAKVSPGSRNSATGTSTLRNKANTEGSYERNRGYHFSNLSAQPHLTYDQSQSPTEPPLQTPNLQSSQAEQGDWFGQWDSKERRGDF